MDGIRTHMADPEEGRIPKHTPLDCEVIHTSGDDDLLETLVIVPAWMSVLFNVRCHRMQEAYEAG